MGFVIGVGSMADIIIRSGQSYVNRVLDTGPIAYWVQGEAAGVTAIDQINSPVQDGTYTGVTLGQPGIGDGQTAPLFDGANDYNNVFTASLATAFDGGEGTVMAWCRVFNAAVWPDGVFRQVVEINNGPDRIVLSKSNAANQLTIAYVSSGVPRIVSVAISSTDWISMGLTWSATANQFRAYFNGVQTGVTNTIAAWGIAPTVAVVGAANLALLSPWYGYIAHIPVWDRPLSPAEMLSLGVL